MLSLWTWNFRGGIDFFKKNHIVHQRSLAGYSPWGSKESDTTERLSACAHTHIFKTKMIHENAQVQLLGFYFILRFNAVRTLGSHSTQVDSVQGFAETPWGHIVFSDLGDVCHSSE